MGGARTPSRLPIAMDTELFRAPTTISQMSAVLAQHVSVFFLQMCQGFRLFSWLTPRQVSARGTPTKMGRRVVGGLLFEYDFRRADCVAGVFPPSGGRATFGSLQKAAGGISCLDGVGVQAATARPTAALVSNGSAARVLSALVASSSFTLELWLRPSAADIANTGSRLPILALGRASVAERGVAEADCYEERHALLVAQRGAFLEVELLEQLYTDSRGTTSPSCFAAEAYADTGERSPAPSPAHKPCPKPCPKP